MSGILSAIRRLYELGQFGQIVKICSEAKTPVAGTDEDELRIMFAESLLFSGHPQRARHLAEAATKSCKSASIQARYDIVLAFADRSAGEFASAMRHAHTAI